MVPVPETRCAKGKERDFNEQTQREPKCKLSTPHRGAMVSPMCIPSPPFRPPAEAQGLELLSQVALELGQASL